MTGAADPAEFGLHARRGPRRSSVGEPFDPTFIRASGCVVPTLDNLVRREDGEPLVVLGLERTGAQPEDAPEHRRSERRSS